MPCEVGSFVLSEGERSVPIVSVAGDFDIYQASDVKNCILGLLEGDLGTASIVVDLRQVGNMGIEGYGVLIRASRECQNKGGNLALICDNPSIIRTLELRSLDKLFAIEGSQADLSAAIVTGKIEL